MICPKCGAEMNRHAEKPVKDPLACDGDAVASIYCCPSCGDVEAATEPQ